MRRIVRRLPVWVRAYPMDCYLIALCLQSGVATLAGFGPRQSLLALMPSWAGWMWSACLLGGAVCWLAGLTGVHQRDGRLVATREPVMRLGLWLLSTAALVYGLAVAVTGGTVGVVIAAQLLLGSALLAVRRAGAQP